jgi:ABC-type Fe3+/spermidine/putrescine transport system ATPase subunit
MDVASNVGYGLRRGRRRQGEIEARVAQALAWCGSTGSALAKPAQLSGPAPAWRSRGR